MRRSLLFMASIPAIALPCLWAAQQFKDRAEIQHHAASATVTANDPRPLDQAINAISEEYGWPIDYEDPPYIGGAELVDSGDPQWLAAHPSPYGHPKSRWIPAGGFFQSEFPESPTTRISPLEEEAVLRKIVADYNQTGNPGKFTVRKEAEGRFAVVGEYVKNEAGQNVPVVPVLDTLISIPAGTRSATETVDLILSNVSSATGVKVGRGASPMNIHKPIVTLGADRVPARTLLLQALEPYGTIFIWRMLYSTPLKLYLLNLTATVRVQHDILGHEKRVPILKR